MSQYINLARLGRLLRKHFAEHLPAYALSSLVLLGGLLAVMCLVSYPGGGISQNGQLILFMLGLLGAGAFFASSALAEYGQGSPAALALTLPASHLEKYLVAWLLSVPVFLVVYTATFYLADWLVLTLAGHASTLVNLFADREGLLTMLLSFLVLHAVALWGSIFFRRQPFIRTGFLLFALVVVLCVLNYQALHWLLGTPLRFTLPLTNARLEGGASLSLPSSQARWLTWVPVALVLLLWPAAYARLTEKQL